MVKHDSNKRFKFSIITAVYNTEEYLAECIESVLNQSIGFLDNIQLILVNDGSTDLSSEICLQYQEKYPENIIVLEKENGGQATARNLGLRYATGEYLNFLDSDDKFELNVLDEVYKFFNVHRDEIDLVSIPVMFFEAKNEGHPLNYKFKKQRVVDLVKEPANPQLFINSAFIKREVFNFEFDPRLVNSEDALIVNKILLRKQKIGLVNKAKYLYRKRITESSTIDNSKKKKGFFNDRLKYFFKELIDYSLEYSNTHSEFNSTKVPEFIQYMIAYDLQWIVSVEDLDILDENEEKEFWKLFNKVLYYIDSDIIFNHLSIRDDYRRFLLAIKYIDFKDFDNAYSKLFLNFSSENSSEVDEEISKDKYLWNKGQFKLNNGFLTFNNKIIDAINNHNLWIDIISLENNILSISGFYSSSFHNKFISIDLIKNDKEIIKTNKIDYSSRSPGKSLGINWNFMHNFEVAIPINTGDEFKFKVTCHDDKDYSFILPIDFSSTTRLSKFSNYHITDSKMIIVKDDTLYIKDYSYFKMIKYELKALWKIYQDKGPYYTSAIGFRLIYLILYKVMRNKRIFIFMDRQEFADDNGEALFKYAIKENDGIKKVFTVNNDSKDFNRLSKIAPILDKFSIFNNKDELVPFYSIKHRILYLFAEKIISSHPDDDILNPFSGKNVKYYNGLINSKTYFLQHGVTKDNISEWLRKYDKDLSLILTVSDLESKSFLDEGYHYDKEIIQTLGFPRFDYLENDDKLLSDDINGLCSKKILFAPSWRNYIWSEKDLIESEYFKCLNGFISNKELLNNLKNKGYGIIFKPHPKLLRFIEYFDTDGVIVDLDTSYRDLFNSSSLLITDYSSVTFDFAYLKKPLIYYQYAKDYNFDLDKSYFDYESMGFGKVVKDENELINKLNEYLDNDCEMESIYENRVDSFFKYQDKNNSKRVYKWILEN